MKFVHKIVINSENPFGLVRISRTLRLILPRSNCNNNYNSNDDENNDEPQTHPLSGALLQSFGFHQCCCSWWHIINRSFNLQELVSIVSPGLEPNVSWAPRNLVAKLKAVMIFIPAIRDAIKLVEHTLLLRICTSESVILLTPNPSAL